MRIIFDPHPRSTSHPSLQLLLPPTLNNLLTMRIIFQLPPLIFPLPDPFSFCAFLPNYLTMCNIFVIRSVPILHHSPHFQPPPSPTSSFQLIECTYQIRPPFPIYLSPEPSTSSPILHLLFHILDYAHYFSTPVLYLPFAWAPITTPYQPSPFR